MAAVARETGNRLLNAALQYATRGHPVFPLHTIVDGQCTCGRGDGCTSQGKHPRYAKDYFEHGLDEATTDAKKIAEWWARWPNANIGLACGAQSGIVVIDIDPEHGGETSLVKVQDENEQLPATLTSLTGGDGMHLVIRHPRDGSVLGNSQGKETSGIAPGIDVRGDGGYIVAPPSLHLSGQRYEWLDPSVPIADLPDWLRDLIVKDTYVAPPARERPAQPAPSSGTTNYARVALDRQCDDIRRAIQGDRNGSVNRAAFRMGQLVAGGQIDEATVRHEIFAAAESLGWDRSFGPADTNATISSGLRGGGEEPQYPDPTRAKSSTAIPPRSASEASAPTSARTTAEQPTNETTATTQRESDGAPPERTREVVDDEDDPDGEINETDLGNARRLIKRHGHELRYAMHLGKAGGIDGGWLRWDGRRWQHDDDGYVHRCAHATAQSILLEAAELHGEDDRKKRTAWSFKSENARALDSAIRIASKLRGTPVVAQQLDADPWLLNVINGTIDLRTGALRKHAQHDLLTKLAPVVYDPTATDDRWDAYLQSALPDAELRSWVQRGVGYTLTGSTIEEILFFVHGPTRSGKSTFLEAIKAVLGDYAKNADFETFLDRGKDGTARSDIARLAGARLVTSNEVDEGRKLAEGLVKTLTGGDTITARYLYMNEFEYLPQFKLVLAANHKPKVRHGDDAIWRRIRLVPFIHPPQTVDPELKNHLSRDPGARSAILAWALEGCRAWQADGLRSVAAVREATDLYRAEQDPLAEFFADHCVFDVYDDHCWVSAADLRSAYEDWCKEQGIKRTLSPDHFRELLEDRGCAKDRRRIDGHQKRIWKGVRLLRVDEDPKLPLVAVTTETPNGPTSPEPTTTEPDPKPEQLFGNAVTPVTNTQPRDARDEQNQGSEESPYVRTHEREFPEPPSCPSRASHETVTGKTRVPDTSRGSVSGITETPVSGDVPDSGVSRVSRSGVVEEPRHLSLRVVDADGHVECENGCGRLVLPAPDAVKRGWLTYCSECEPF